MKKFALLVLTIILFWGCTDDGPSGPSVDDFDREAILENWADNLIIPSFSNFSETTGQLHSSAVTFASDPTQQNLESLRDSWEASYLAFQYVSMFEMGLAMQIRYRDYLNIYPTDTVEIENSIQSGSYNLELPSLTDSQGFPALDYLMHGIGQNDAEILSYYTTNENAGNYLTDLTERINSLTNQVLGNWTSGYRDE